ncbi:phosphatase PAP2 family protein [Shewanella waksmanii]|uniref:phosphatase PAP2 family protein n=1 Tax=Shewanella waksmanii TaxID=213783 RepID=UPI0037350499
MLPTVKMVNTPPQQQLVSVSTNHHALAMLLVLFVLHILTLRNATNVESFHALNQLGSYIPDWLLLSITDIGEGLTAGALMLICLIYRPHWLFKVLAASALCMISVYCFKTYFDAPRPPALVDVSHIVGRAEYERSFPSGHTTTAFAFAGVVWLMAKNWTTKCLILTLAFMVAFSRIAVGAHWPEDVAFGAILGWLCAYIGCTRVPLATLSIKRLYQIILVIAVGVSAEEILEIGQESISLMLFNRYVLITVLLSLAVYSYRKIVLQR